MRTVRKRLAKPLMPMLNSDGQPRTERDGNTEKRKDVINVLYSRRLLKNAFMHTSLSLSNFKLLSFSLLFSFLSTSVSLFCNHHS